MADDEEIIYDSGPSEPLDEFWLEQGRKMLEDSIGAVREGAKSLLTGLGLLQAIYLGILGFGDFVPKSMPLPQKSLFLLPLLFWLVALYHSLQVMMTKRLNINLHSPDDIRKKSENTLREKQGNLRCAFWMLSIGLVSALLLFLIRLRM